MSTTTPLTDRLAPTPGERLLLARLRAGLTADELAKRIGISRNTITSYEHGRTSPRLLELRAWADATGFTLADLLGEEHDRGGGPGGGQRVVPIGGGRGGRDQGSAASRCIEQPLRLAA